MTKTDLIMEKLAIKASLNKNELLNVLSRRLVPMVSPKSDLISMSKDALNASSRTHKQLRRIGEEAFQRVLKSKSFSRPDGIATSKKRDNTLDLLRSLNITYERALDDGMIREEALMKTINKAKNPKYYEGKQ